MNQSKLVLSMIFLFFNISVFADVTAPEKAKIIRAPVSHVFVPQGFDSNDNVQVVAVGHFPSTCYQLYNYQVKRYGEKYYVNVNAIYQGGRVCADAMVPFKQEISLGATGPGKYQVVVNPKSSFSARGFLPVMEARTNRIDDFTYAYVEYVGAVKGNPSKAKIGGYIASDCFKFDRFHKMSNKRDVVAVLPILKQVKKHCPMKLTPFEYVIDVPRLSARQVLLHVRSMDGQSVNKVLYY